MDIPTIPDQMFLLIVLVIVAFVLIIIVFQWRKIAQSKNSILILEKEIELLCENECEKLFLEVRESNEVALKFYEGMGFTQIDVRKDYYDKPVENAFIMVKEL